MQKNQKPFIFINYRREGSQANAQSVKQSLERHFGKGAVFFDTYSIPVAEELETYIFEHLDAAFIMLTLIHPTWLKDPDPNNKYIPKLQSVKDWVYREIKYFLDQGKTIIPVRINDIEHPKERDLPDGISRLANIKSCPLRMDEFDLDMEQIIKVIEANGGQRIAQEVLPAVSADEHPSAIDQFYPLPENYRTPVHLKHIHHPFIGLHYFTKDDAPIYFGRDADIQKLINKIEDKDFRLLLFYGSSGVGKSSLLNAGLMPRMPKSFIFERICRRDLDKGLDTQLKEISQTLEGYTGSVTRLVILDQVEEMFTNPNSALPDEADQFFEWLIQWLRKIRRDNLAIKVILSFREEHYNQIAHPLDEQGIDFKKHYLQALTKKGVREAIEGVTKSKELQQHFQLRMDPEFVEEMVTRLYRQPEGSHIAPLMQLQLRSMWDYILEKAYPDKIFTTNLHYIFSQERLDQMMDYQLDKLPERWRVERENGLILDLLHLLVTSKGTADEQSLATLKARYLDVPKLDLRLLLLDLKNAYLVFSKDGERFRLAHDQLGPIIRRQYLHSDKPVQNAWRILEAKNALKINKEEVEFSESDIRIIEKVQDYLPAYDGALKNQMQADKQRFDLQRNDRFNLAFGYAKKGVSDLNYDAGLKNLRVAAQEGIGREAVHQLALEIPYGFYWAKQFDACQDWLDWMVSENHLAAAQTAGFPRPGSSEFGPRFLGWLEAFHPDNYQLMQKRHFPTLIPIKGGAFEMGSEEGHKDEKPVHQVTVSDFFLAETSVTFWQYGIYCLDQQIQIPFDNGFGKADHPIINVNWFEALKYCNWLSHQHGLEPVYSNIEGTGNPVCDWSKNGYRLPTEAEWEFAAREGGKKIRFGNGKDEAKLAEMNYNGNHEHNKYYQYVEKGMRSEGTNPVFQFKPNSLGLYDMSGNVYDWCWDRYTEENRVFGRSYYKKSKNSIDPTGPESQNRQEYRIIRGGSWYGTANWCRCAYRYSVHPLFQGDDVGFRVSRRSQ